MSLPGHAHVNNDLIQTFTFLTKHFRIYREKGKDRIKTNTIEVSLYNFVYFKKIIVCSRIMSITAKKE